MNPPIRLRLWSVLPILAMAALPMAGNAAIVSLPFSDDFNDTTVGSWVQTNGTYTHNGSTLSVASGNAGNQIGGASVEVSELGGAATVGFTASVEFDPTTNSSAGFGLFSSNSHFGANSNSYYLLDVVPNSGGQIRLYQINVSSGGGIGVESGFGGTVPITYSLDEIYTLTVEGSYNGSGHLTLDYTVTSTGGDNVNIVDTDTSVLTGQHFGIETFGSGTMQFDNFSLAAIPEPSSLVLSGAGLLAITLRRRRKQA